MVYGRSQVASPQGTALVGGRASKWKQKAGQQAAEEAKSQGMAEGQAPTRGPDGYPGGCGIPLWLNIHRATRVVAGPMIFFDGKRLLER